MNKDLMAEYGEAAVALEIATNRFNDVKRRVVEELNKPKEVKTEESK